MPRSWVSCGLLLILGGEPMMAVLALGAAATAVWVRHGRPRASWWPLLAGLTAGTLVALPQIVEFLRILPGSARAALGYSVESRLAASWDPRMLVEWLLPLPFGRPGRGFWAPATLDGRPPLFLTLYPGLLALALVTCVRGLDRQLRRWSWWMIATGIFVALGGWNPLMHLAMRLPLASSIRFPINGAI